MNVARMEPSGAIREQRSIDTRNRISLCSIRATAGV
jgi:hypothetical protein